MMQRKRKVVLSTLGAMLIASIFICSWFRPEAVRERNLDFLKHEAAEFIREQSADNIFSYDGEIIGTIEQDAALYSVSLSSQDFDQYILYGTAYILQAISSRKLPAVSYYEYNTEGGGTFLSDNILATFNYVTGEYGFVKAASKFPSASSLITSRLGSEYLDFMANKERVVDLL